MPKALFTVKQLEPDEYVGTVIDFVPDLGEVIFTPRLNLGLTARDQCGDGTDEYLHNEPLVTWPVNQFPIKYYYSQISMGLQKGIDAAFVEINKLYGKTFFERTVNQAEAKVIISLMRIDVAGNTLARAQWFYSLSKKEITRATITFDSSENWSYLENESCGSNGNIFDIGNVGMHEIGHIVGLAHAPTDKLQTMYASTGPGQTLGRSFGNGDTKGFSLAYKLQQPEPDPDPDPEPEPDNKAPVAQDINVTIESNQETMIQLKATDPENGPLTYIILRPDHGNVTLAEPDIVFYVPETNYTGIATFRYYAEDEKGFASNIATVKITINQANKPPIAENLLVETVQDTPITITLEATDPEGEKITFQIVDMPEQGKLDILSADKLVYRPNTGFAGNDKFTYIAIDEVDNMSNEANVTILVRATTPPGPEPEGHKLTQLQLIRIKTLRLVYEQLDKAGMKDAAERAREELQQYQIDALIELHS